MLTPDDEKDCDESDRLEIVTGRVPAEDNVTLSVLACPWATVPKSTDDALITRVGVAAPN